MRCKLTIETDDDSLSFEGHLNLVESGFTWRLEETSQEFEFPSSRFLVFAK